MNQTYAYDSFGNLTQYGSFQPTYNANNQMNNWVYDAAGNLLQTGTAALTWDAESRLTSAGGASYLYDAFGERVESDGISATGSVYFGGRPVARYSGGQWTDLIYGPNGLIAEVAGSENAEPQYRAVDPLGTLVGTMTSNQLLTNPMDYTPFGQVFTGSTNDPYFFTGKERDQESGLDYFGARYYASSMGRFISSDAAGPDPKNPQALNLYRYALNNPLRYVDPDGRYEIDVHLALTAALAYAAGYSQKQATLISEVDQGVDSPNSALNPLDGYGFAGSGARKDFHFTTAARRADMWGAVNAWASVGYGEQALGLYLHADQDSYSHSGYGAFFGHLFFGHHPDKTYNDPDKADVMAGSTYSALRQAGLATAAGSVPYMEILPFIQAFNRAHSAKDKKEQLNLMLKYAENYRQQHPIEQQRNPSPPSGAGVCKAEFKEC